MTLNVAGVQDPSPSALPLVSHAHNSISNVAVTVCQQYPIDQLDFSGFALSHRIIYFTLLSLLTDDIAVLSV